MWKANIFAGPLLIYLMVDYEYLFFVVIPIKINFTEVKDIQRGSNKILNMI